MKRKIVAMIMASMLVFSLVACGSSSSSSETAEDTTANEGSTEEAEESDNEAEEVEEETTTGETVEESAEEPVEETAEIPEWAQTIYDSLINSDLDTVYEIIEAEDFVDQLTVYAEDDDVTLDYFTISDEDTLVVYTWYGYFSGEGYEDISDWRLVGVLGTDTISADEEAGDVTLRITDVDEGLWAEVSTDTYNGETTVYRDALIGTMFYIDYGSENAAVADLTDYQ